jgi:hypothetical protein
MTILYDFIEVAGGAEKVSIELAQYLKCPLIVSGANEKVFNSFPKRELEISILSSLTSVPIWKTIKSIYAFENIKKSLLDSEKIIFSGSNAPIAVHRSSAKQNIYYCHTPPRFAYDLYEHYQKTLPPWQALAIKQLAQFVKKKIRANFAKDGFDFSKFFKCSS